MQKANPASAVSSPGRGDIEHKRNGRGEFRVLPLCREGCLNLNNLITKEYRMQGLSLHEVGDRILELRLNGEILHRFPQTGVEPENILKVSEQVLRERRN